MNRPAAQPPVAPPPAGSGRGATLLRRLPLGESVLGLLGRRGVLALTVAAFVAFVVVMWSFRAAGGLLALGAFIGLLSVRRVPAARSGLGPIGGLAVAVRPLALPLLVVVGTALLKAGPLVQVACGLVLVLIGWYGAFGPERRNGGRDRPRRGRHSVLTATWVLAMGAVAMLAVLPVLERSGRASTQLFVAAVALVLGALVLRLGGFARSRMRALLTIALALALTRLAMEGGLITGHDWLVEHAPGIDAPLLLTIAGGVLAFVCVAEIATRAVLTRDASGGLSGWRARLAVQLEAPLVPRSITDAMSTAGLLAAAIAALALAAAVVSATSAGREREQLDKLTLEPISPGRPARAADKLGDRALAEMYSPVLLFTAAQKWTPTKVDDYLKLTRMTDWKDDRTRTPSVKRLPDSCPGIVSKPCYTLRCIDEDQCAAPSSKHDRANGAVYARVERRERWSARRRGRSLAPQARSPNPFTASKELATQQPLIRDTNVLLQYWYFYPYDDWLAPVLGGQFKQRHEADWEAITIGLGDDGPLYVGYSSHCGGTWSAWDDIRVADNEQPRLHPLVAVAEGSQANYRAAEARRAPDWAKCAGLPGEVLTLVSYAANLRDQTDSTTSWTPSEHVLVHATTQPMRFLGRWAPNSRTTLENARKGRRLGKDTPGPATPTLQPLWSRPLTTIFGGGTWHEEQ